jgi:two-component system, OmpR family, response regulator
MRILLVEDEDRIAAFLEEGLSDHGYEVVRAATGAEAIERALEGVELVVLDLGLPDLDGLDVITTMRESRLQAPIIVLTARGELADRLTGLDRGADDYLVKPFAFDELLARIRAQVRSMERRLPTMLEVGPVSMDLLARQVSVDGRPIELTSREFALLEKFLRAPGAVYTRGQLLSEIWGIDFDPRSNLVDVYVGYLRRKVGPSLIETVRTEGYRLRIDAA